MFVTQNMYGYGNRQSALHFDNVIFTIVDIIYAFYIFMMVIVVIVVLVNTVVVFISFIIFVILFVIVVVVGFPSLCEQTQSRNHNILVLCDSCLSVLGYILTAQGLLSA